MTTTPSLDLQYDEKRDLYIVNSGDKRGTVLREKTGIIIRDDTNKDALLAQFHDNPDILADLPLAFEKPGYWVRHNYHISSLYFSGLKEINNKHHTKALELFKKATHMYPPLLLYSDISFFMGRCYEQLGKKEDAAASYQQFIDKAEQNYSRRFHEAHRLDPCLYIQQLEYSRNYIKNNPGEFKDSFTENDTVKYFNNYRYPGFEVGLHTGLSSVGFAVAPDLYTILNTSFSIGISYTFNSWCNAGGTIVVFSPFLCEITGGFQLFRTKSRKFGISLESSFFYMNNDNYDFLLHFFNTGITLGTGVYIVPDLFAGGYYTYYLFNEYFPFSLTKNGIKYSLWNTNSYRITLRFLPLQFMDMDVSFWNNELYIGVNAYFYTYTFFTGYAFLDNKIVIMLNSRDLFYWDLQ